MRPHTLIFPDILERKGQASILALDNADLAKRTLANDPKQLEMVEVNLTSQ